MDVTVRIAQHLEADALLGRCPLALLIGAVLDRAVPSETAYAAPLVIARRLGGDLDAHQLARQDLHRLVAVFEAVPAVHPLPLLMARHVQELCRYLAARHGGRAAAVWEDVGTGRELYSRLNALPGFGRQKAQIVVALLGKRFGVRPDGWREAAGPFGEDGVFRSVADVTDPESLARVRLNRQQERHAAREAARARQKARRPAPRDAPPPRTCATAL
ncbi:HhH-GPD-type base excision DNA repair protein [Kitasatospora sp. NPDC057542]|uniref:HhH-GPD-type base excision DNA repair protein n=1 Tax=Kitasatospora sp. NPDC057542 TaxID=3346162 RepID=UPI00368E9560